MKAKSCLFALVLATLSINATNVLAQTTATYTKFRVTYHTHRDDKNTSTWLGTDIVQKPSGEHIATKVTINTHFKDPSNVPVEIPIAANVTIPVADIHNFGVHIEIRGGHDDWYFNYTVEAFNSATGNWETLPGFANHGCDDAHKTGGLHVAKNSADGITDWF